MRSVEELELKFSLHFKFIQYLSIDTPSPEFIKNMKKDESKTKSSAEGPQYLADVFNEISNNCKVYSISHDKLTLLIFTTFI